MMTSGIAGAGRRKARVAALLGGLAVLVITAAAVLGVMTPWRTASKPSLLSGVGGPFTLTDQEGRTVTDADFHGKWVLLYFGYTHCPDVCPTAVNAMAGAIDALGASRAKIQALFITLDPERDTPAVLKDYTSAFQAGILGLTGTAQQIGKVAGAYHIAYVKRLIPEDNDYSIDHSSVIFLIDPAGKPVSVFSHETPPDRLAQNLQEEMR